MNELTNDRDLIGDVHIENTTQEQLLTWLFSRPATAQHVHFVNAFSVVSARADQALARAFSNGICVPDGAPVVWGLRWAHGGGRWRSHNRVPGPDLFVAALDQGRQVGLRHYLLGGSPGTLDLLVRQIGLQFPGAQVVGAVSPPFAPVEEIDWSSHLADIRASHADVVWIGLGTPKQDFVGEILAAEDDRVYLTVGAAFDFVAGTVSRAPGWMQRVGMEWLYRLLAEPRRLWRRYLLGNVAFLRLALAGAMRARTRSSRT